MSSTLFFLLALTALIPQAFPISIPANPAVGLTNIISVDTPGDNPLPPSPPGWYNIPGTSLSIILTGPFGTFIRSPADAADCLAAAQTALAATIAAVGDIPIPHPDWHFSSHNVQLIASAPFPTLGTYGQLSSALRGLLYLITRAGGPGARQLGWVLSDGAQGLGIVMRGSMAPRTITIVGAAPAGPTAGGAMGGGTGASVAAMATATATQSVSIVGVKELDGR
ncbi:hypothetical protein HO173_006967 [Letharia columbiana]|uniref:Uncharacterized protein n=1 Tax=Letharia columbiana TaxID=112416 RepID=A0A8H6L400_9LECA|nr:uncharacterized protein HO173_006967 [Letharia columbiana]KAF6234747.1 hypothetical protein HO173_006967 [Letharia columbiana]